MGLCFPLFWASPSLHGAGQSRCSESFAKKKVTAHPIWTIQKICKNLEKMPSLPQTEPSCCPLPHVQKRKLFTIFVIDETIRLIQISWKHKIVVLSFFIETEPLEFFIILMLETLVFLYNRAQWIGPSEQKTPKIKTGHTYSYVKLNFRVGLFFCIFWFEAIFCCFFGILYLPFFTWEKWPK